jgi:hypothetical protein
LTLVSLTLKATFVAAVQATILQISVANNSTKLEVCTNAVSFASLMLDIIGVVGCLYMSRILRDAVMIMGYIIETQAVPNTERYHEGEADIDAALPHVPTSQDIQSSAQLNETTNITPVQSNLIEILQAFKYRRMVGRANFVSGTIGYGAVGLIVSILFLSIATQPRAVWITTLATIGFTAFLALHQDLVASIGFPRPRNADSPHDGGVLDSMLDWLERVTGRV